MDSFPKGIYRGELLYSSSVQLPSLPLPHPLPQDVAIGVVLLPLSSKLFRSFSPLHFHLRVWRAKLMRRP
jgi:hypothetical protein